MSTRIFNQYNFVTGAIEGSLAYDFSRQPVFEPDEYQEYPEPKKKQKEQTDNKSNVAMRFEGVFQDALKAAVMTKRGLSPLAWIGSIAVVFVIVIFLLSQIQLMDVSNQTVELEQKIEALEDEQGKLTVAYETCFNIASVEEYATEVLGMTEAAPSQVIYLSGIEQADKAVVIEKDEADMFGAGFQALSDSLNEYWQLIKNWRGGSSK